MVTPAGNAGNGSAGSETLRGLGACLRIQLFKEREV
jgi:hypothetical protein